MMALAEIWLTWPVVRLRMGNLPVVFLAPFLPKTFQVLRWIANAYGGNTVRDCSVFGRWFRK